MVLHCTFYIAHNYCNHVKWAWLHLENTVLLFNPWTVWRGTMVLNFWTNMVIYFFCVCVHNFGVQFIPFELGKVFEGKKKRTKSMHETIAVTWGFKLWPWKEWLEKHFESICQLNLSYFPTNCISNCSICSRLSTNQFFFQCCFQNLCFQLQQNLLWTDEIRHVWLVPVQA